MEFPLITKHQVTPSAYISVNQSITEEEIMRRNAKTPLINSPKSDKKKFKDARTGTSIGLY